LVRILSVAYNSTHTLKTGAVNSPQFRALAHGPDYVRISIYIRLYLRNDVRIRILILHSTSSLNYSRSQACTSTNSIATVLYRSAAKYCTTPVQYRYLLAAQQAGRPQNKLSEHVAESTHLQVRRVCQGKHLLNDYKQNIENDFNVLNCILVTIARPLLFGFALFLSPLVFRKFADFASTRVFRLHRSFIANLLRSTATSFANAFSILRSHTAAKHSYTVDFI